MTKVRQQQQAALPADTRRQVRRCLGRHGSRHHFTCSHLSRRQDHASNSAATRATACLSKTGLRNKKKLVLEMTYLEA